MKKVLLINYNRPEKTQASLKPIMAADELYLFCDGPKIKPANTQKVRQILTETARKRESLGLVTKIYLSQRNLGSKGGPTEAIKWFFSNVESGTIIEDDIVISNHTLSMHEILLEKFKDSDYLWVGGGFPLPQANSAIIATKTSQLIAWATWKDKAEKALKHSEEKTTAWKQKGIKLLNGLSPKTKLFLWKEFNKLEKNLEWSWAYRWLQYQLVMRKPALTPTARMHTNIGYDGSGHNCFNVFGVKEDADSEDVIQKTISKELDVTNDLKLEKLREWRYYGRIHQMIGRFLYKITPKNFKPLWKPVI